MIVSNLNTTVKSFSFWISKQNKSIIYHRPKLCKNRLIEEKYYAYTAVKVVF